MAWGALCMRVPEGKNTRNIVLHHFLKGEEIAIHADIQSICFPEECKTRRQTRTCSSPNLSNAAH